jgi:hypothetical protein
MAHVRFTIGIQPDLLPENSFSDRWIPRLEAMGHEVRLMTVSDPDFVERVSACDGFLWWFPPLPRARDVGKKILPALDQARRVFVHPDTRSCWHFDDKVAQTYLLKASQVPTPKTWVFWRYDHAIAFFRDAQYPLVVKLASGVRSQNVALLHDAKEAERVARRMFGKGAETFEPRSFALLRVASRPVRNGIRRVLAMPPLPLPEVHRNYLLIQEFVAGNDGDTRVNVIGNRAFAFRRPNRPNDFRASGSKMPDLDPSKIALDAIRLAFDASRALRMPILCFDVLRQGGSSVPRGSSGSSEFLGSMRDHSEELRGTFPRNSEEPTRPVITEISYYFNAPTIGQCPGHWRMNGDELEWVEGAMRAEDAVLDDFLARLSSFRNIS